MLAADAHREAPEPAMKPEQSRAMASLFEGDRERVRGLLSRFRAGGDSLESEIRGWSMTGSLAPGSRIRIRCEGPNELERGAVVAVLGEGSLVAHRLGWVGRRGAARGWIIARGDATLLCDAPVAEADVVGHVAAVDDGGGWRDVPGPPPRRRAAAAALVLAACVMALHIHPSLARALATSLWRWKARREGLSALVA